MERPPGWILTGHAARVLVEREIEESLVWRTVLASDRTEAAGDGKTHFLKAFAERGGRGGGAVELKVDRESDALYLRLDDSKIHESEEICPGIIVDFDESGRLIGVEIIELSKRVPPEAIRRVELETA